MIILVNFYYHFLFLVSANHENFQPGNEEGSNKKGVPNRTPDIFLLERPVSLYSIIDHIRISIRGLGEEVVVDP